MAKARSARLLTARLAGGMLLSACWLCAAATAAVQDRSLRQLRFSPDGRYVLAQNGAEIAVLTVQPFALRFRIPAQDATDAQFTPDSRQVVFLGAATRVDNQKVMFAGSSAHVDRWDIRAQARAQSQIIPMFGCGTQQLSPDALVLACVDFEGTLRLIDASSGQVIVERKNFVRLLGIYGYRTDLPVAFLDDRGSAHMDFSADGRYFLAVPWGRNGRALAYDMRDKHTLAPKDGLGWLRGAAAENVLFAFVGVDRMLMTRHGFGEVKHGAKTGRLVAFPSGRVVSKPKVPPGRFLGATGAGSVIIRPFGPLEQYDQSKRAAAVGLGSGEVVVSDTPAIDVFGRYYIAEPSPGVVGLYERGKGLQATVALHPK